MISFSAANSKALPRLVRSSGSAAIDLLVERGRKALVEWTADHPVDRILMVDLTRLLMSAPHLRDRQELNPINQEHEVRPTWRVGLDGERIKDTPPADVEQTFPADLLSGDGDSLWHGVARTHEANDQTAIAKSQCLALRDTLRDRDGAVQL